MYTFFEKTSKITGLPCLYVRYTHQPESSNKCLRLLVASSHDLLVVNGNKKFYNKADLKSKIRLALFCIRNGKKLEHYIKQTY